MRRMVRRYASKWRFSSLILAIDRVPVRFSWSGPPTTTFTLTNSTGNSLSEICCHTLPSNLKKMYGGLGRFHLL